MSNRRRTILITIVFVVIVIIPFTFINRMLTRGITVYSVDMDNGVMDLTGIDFTNGVAMRGANIECFINELVTPEQIENRTGEFYKSFPDVSQLTTRIQVLVPENREYMIYFKSTDFVSKIYINGKLQKEIGIIGDSYENTVPRTEYYYFSVYPINGQIEVVQQSANYYSASTAGHYVNISFPETVKAYITKLQFNDTLRIAIFFTVFIIHLGYFMFHPRLRANIYFSMITLVFFIREGLMGFKMWAALIPEISWFVLFRGEYITACLCCIFFLLYISSFFDKLINKKLLAIFILWNIIYMAIILIAPPMVFTGLMKYYSISLVVIIIYILVRLLMHIRTFATEQYILLVGMLILFYGVIEDLVFYQTFAVQTPFMGSGTSVGIMVCVFVQMLALFLRTQRDIYEAREASHQLAIQNTLLDKTNRMKTKFLGNISHELKTPLTIVSNYTELARLHAERKQPKDEYIIRNMKLASSETERIALMVSQLLDVVRIEEASMKYDFSRVNIQQLIEQTINNYFPVLNKNHNTIHTMIADNLPYVYADKERIKQVIVNLITNSIRFTKNGEITVGAKPDETYEKVIIYVSDTGCGISREQQGHLFERFYTSEEKDTGSSGTGLGLYICKSIIEAHDGNISVESELDIGTTMTFMLSVYNKEG